MDEKRPCKICDDKTTRSEVWTVCNRCKYKLLLAIRDTANAWVDQASSVIGRDKLAIPNSSLSRVIDALDAYDEAMK